MKTESADTISVPPGRLAGVTNWALYYGGSRPPGLGRRQLAVVAPEAWDEAGVASLHKQGALVLAYVSVLEVPALPGVPAPPAVLRIGGEPVRQAEWGTWVLDPRRPDVGAKLVSRASALLDLGFDGLFLDTIGDVENRDWPRRLTGQLVPAAAFMVADLRTRFPTALLVQNWGLGDLLDLTAPYLDGICWEDVPVALPEPWQERLALRMQTLAAAGMRVFALTKVGPSPWAEELGFAVYAAPGEYTRFDWETGVAGR